MNKIYISVLVPENKWKSEKEITRTIQTDLETDTILCLEKRELKKKDPKPQNKNPKPNTLK